MKLVIKRETLLTPLQIVSSAVEKRQTKPILGNVLIDLKDNKLALTATDLEVEVSANIQINSGQEKPITVPARKLLDICKNIDQQADIELLTESNRIIVKTGKSRFVLSTLPADDFPLVTDLSQEQSFSISQGDLKYLLDKSAFAMAQQDVRYYLNGLLMELEGKYVRAVATDGHRLAFCQIEKNSNESGHIQQVIIPRKGIAELLKLLTSGDDEVSVYLTPNHIRLTFANISFVSKLIDGRFPAYERVIPEKTENILLLDKEIFRHALVRVAILSNEKYKGIRMLVKEGNLKIQAHNPENEQAEEEMEVTYSGEEVELGFNVNYLLDVISVIESEYVQIAITDSENSVLISSSEGNNSKYVIMPMRL
jgi:DNA polymerase-3 subunit beta